MEAQVITCPTCQTVNPAKNLFCQSCGKPLLPQPAKPAETVPADAELPPFDLPMGSPVNQSKPVPVANPSPSAPVNDPFGMPPTMVYPPVQQNMPPQGGYAPQAYPTQGYPPQNMPPQGNFPPQGFPPQNMPPQGGYPPQGLPPQGYPPQGFPPQGYAQQGVPPQPAFYPPPPPVAQPAGVERLGVRTDGWMDVIAGEAAQAEAIEKAFVEELKSREIPLVNVDRMEFNAGFNKKSYQVVHHPAGSVAVNVAAAGKDLVCSWALYVPQTPNWRMLGILAGIAFGVSFLTSLGMVGNFGYFFVQWIFGTFGWLWQVALLALLAGQVWKGSWWYFFIVNSPDSAKESLAALVLVVHQSLLAAVAKSGLDVSQLRGK